ncbi:54S ribosomal protein L20, mitochondrial [Colletotrichum plurivorum]|uniref:54S ribosomal protein L20, mitochondrial n=1 Tax=Colletotrichum plurivorum TaxID=2175906 RepID=A0A8H6NH99_9PEZI|nr:54S ribosomal protein L20, mitochondrial [Colletotrichum plurivorum]
MEARTLTRPATAALATLLRPARVSAVQCRGHKTTTRTKKALNIAPHPDFVPSASLGGGHTILVNPPAAAPSVYHTPFKFLPPTDPRRRANLSSLFNKTTPSNESSSSTSSTSLPPAIKVPARGANPRYHLTKDDVAEIRRLRAEDPVKWSVTALARKFDCSEVFITICTPAPREHKERVAARLEAVKSKWGGIRTRAREDRSRRKEMLFKGEL